MKGSLFVIALFLNLLAPMPPGIAMNPETLVCGYYRGGDEYVSYNLPSPWVVNYGESIEDENGTHQWNREPDSFESFCEELGYAYVSDNLAEVYGKRKSSPVFLTVFYAKHIPLLS